MASAKKANRKRLERIAANHYDQLRLAIALKDSTKQLARLIADNKPDLARETLDATATLMLELERTFTPDGE